MDCRKLPLRILYTLNGNPQYILARSAGVVPIELIPLSTNATASSSHTPPPARYATTSLKTCLDTMCHSSPELIQDRTRDFSVYLLDPLEADCVPTQPSSFQSNTNPPADPTVAVGLGLMSWALAADEHDSVPVTGTLKANAGGREMLELIFSLRSTAPMEKASLSDTLRSWSLPSLPSSQPTTASQESRKPTKYPPSRGTSKARAAPTTKSDAFLKGDIYIGPARQPVGRRPRSNTSTENRKPAAKGQEEAVEPLPPPSKADNEKIVDFLASFPSDEERNRALNGIIQLVQDKNGSSSTEWINAIAMLATISQSTPNSQPGPTLSRSQSQPEGVALFAHHARRKSSSAEEPVPLNKENVNPHQRPQAKGNTAPLGSAWSEPSLATQPAPLAASNQTPSRKRSWNDFLDGSEPADTQRQRGQYYRQPEEALQVVAASSPGPSVPRRLEAMPMVAPSRPIISASSPVRGLRRRPTPAWAITSTATKPRFSNDVLERVRLQQERKEEEAKDGRRQKAREFRRRQRESKTTQSSDPPSMQPRAVSGPPTAPTTPLRSSTNTASLPGPITAVGGFSLGPQTPRNNRSPELTPKNAPCTPPRKRANTITSSAGPSSLFTPASTSWDTVNALALQKTPMSPSNRTKNKAHDQGDSTADVLLDQELDNAFDELSSCPATSGDHQNGEDYDTEESDGDVAPPPPPKQHWEGLPPSSPPPPSSPYLLPTRMMEDDLDGGSEPENSASPAATSELPTCEIHQLLSMDVYSTAAAPSDDAAIFEQFMTQMDSDDSQTIENWGLGELETPDFDLNEFVNACRPLLEEGQSEAGEGTFFDAAKVAQDIQSLLNGCVV
ncbi:hypothetical protein MIND_00037000 [Mycena indigotica]|uniref:Ams2/SPT21 N-terminal domain-containing protein n=1 Tax=Mycena indigotica TaxID=2126181 RepID=A0A8H6WFX7_9AGAR|nr:uncharacterized protein MIND_00037000 [Mycena indigotica]KAF7315226.1 hypothetical protein MIND_00037000 [Mycena indigotica]